MVNNVEILNTNVVRLIKIEFMKDGRRRGAILNRPLSYLLFFLLSVMHNKMYNVHVVEVYEYKLIAKFVPEVICDM